MEVVIILDENSDLWDTRDVQEFGLFAKRRGDIPEEEVLMTGFNTESDDEEGSGGMSGINLDVDLTLADG